MDQRIFDRDFLHPVFKMEYPTNFNYVYEAISDLDQIPSTSAHNQLVPTNLEAQNAKVNAITENPEPAKSKQLPTQLEEPPARSEHEPARSEHGPAQSDHVPAQPEQATTSKICNKPQVIADQLQDVCITQNDIQQFAELVAGDKYFFGDVLMDDDGRGRSTPVPTVSENQEPPTISKSPIAVSKFFICYNKSCLITKIINKPVMPKLIGPHAKQGTNAQSTAQASNTAETNVPINTKSTESEELDGTTAPSTTVQPPKNNSNENLRSDTSESSLDYTNDSTSLSSQRAFQPPQKARSSKPSYGLLIISFMRIYFRLTSARHSQAISYLKTVSTPIKKT